MPSINIRLDKLELRQGTDSQRLSRIDADAATVRDRLAALAAGFDDEDRFADDGIQARWSLARRLAWCMRFRQIEGPRA
ncbi:hypothetical protein [uncultured Sphingomonas sp.]|uniref:hypothetical protein n=1 Tax=uncultured Sphingomonas sp. TaxID=158754 RepID=UPI0025E722EE|nr:hypothetical protein [uncultured Sphingomonas sp.]